MPKPHSAGGVKKLLVWGKKEKLTMPSEQASTVANAETSKALKEGFADYPAAEEYLGPRTSGKDAGADRSKANPAGHSLEWSDLPYVRRTPSTTRVISAGLRQVTIALSATSKIPSASRIRSPEK